MQIQLNGQAQQLEESISISALLAQRGINPVQVAIEINGEIVPRRLHESTIIAAGDRIEIVEFIGGG